MSRGLYWGLTLPLFCVIVLGYLREANPGSDCAYCGRTPGFWWGGSHGLPGPREYSQYRSYYELLFLAQYLPFAFLITGIGGAVVPTMTRRIRADGRRALVAGGLTFTFLVALAILSDLCRHCQAQTRAPTFLLHNSYYVDTVIALSKVFLPATVMSMLLALMSKPVSDGKCEADAFRVLRRSS
jgi:hypothetical protein